MYCQLPVTLPWKLYYFSNIISILNCHQYYCQFFLNLCSLPNVRLFRVLHFEFPSFCCATLHLNLILKPPSFPTRICKFSQILKYLFYSKNCFRILLFFNCYISIRKTRRPKRVIICFNQTVQMCWLVPV